MLAAFMDDLSALPPDRLFELFESGRIDRETLQALMAIQARQLIEEMDEDRQNPAAAFIEHLRNLRVAIKLARRHGQQVLRDVFSTLARMEGFPPTKLLWNASHAHVPLHCFFRTKREPVFRVLKLVNDGAVVRIEIEYGVRYPKAVHREAIVLKRDERWQLQVQERETLPVK